MCLSCCIYIYYGHYTMMHFFEIVLSLASQTAMYVHHMLRDTCTCTTAAVLVIFVPSNLPLRVTKNSSKYCLAPSSVYIKKCHILHVCLTCTNLFSRINTTGILYLSFICMIEWCFQILPFLMGQNGLSIRQMNKSLLTISIPEWPTTSQWQLSMKLVWDQKVKHYQWPRCRKVQLH